MVVFVAFYLNKLLNSDKFVVNQNCFMDLYRSNNSEILMSFYEVKSYKDIFY